MMISLFLAVALLFHHRNYYEFIQERIANLVNLCLEKKGKDDKKILVLRVEKKQSIDGETKRK